MKVLFYRYCITEYKNLLHFSKDFMAKNSIPQNKKCMTLFWSVERFPILILLYITKFEENKKEKFWEVFQNYSCTNSSFSFSSPDCTVIEFLYFENKFEIIGTFLKLCDSVFKNKLTLLYNK